jgi:hypothetical protein
MVLLGKIALGMFGTVAAAAGLICSEGFIEVNVVTKQPNEQHHIVVIAPAMLVPIAAHFIPPDKLDHGARELKQYMPTVRAALEDVTEPGEHVLVKKEGGSVTVNVVDKDETVYVSTPIRAIESTVEQIANASDHAKNTDSVDFQ